MLRSVIQVKPTNEFKVYVYFSDGKIKLYDVAPLIKQGGVFEKISDESVFTDKCTVINGTLAWDIGGNFDEYNCIDIDPESIYEKGIDVSDPLKEGVA